ncbi:hypothetical protein V2I01_41525 [Micromonospora sp. BRA006-A]|nr:hypothetical protein [Micromonospora sp. BRA006-A]
MAVTSGRHERLEVPPLSVVEVGRMLAQPCHRAERIHALGGAHRCTARRTGTSTTLPGPEPAPAGRPGRGAAARGGSGARTGTGAAAAGTGRGRGRRGARSDIRPDADRRHVRAGPADRQDLTDRLVAREVLRADLHEEPALRFRHPVLCAAVYQQVPPGRRRTLHATAARCCASWHPAPAYADHLADRPARATLDAARTLLSAAGHPFVPAADTVRWLSVAARLAPSASARSRLPRPKGCTWPTRWCAPAGLPTGGACSRRRGPVGRGRAGGGGPGPGSGGTAARAEPPRIHAAA